MPATLEANESQGYYVPRLARGEYAGFSPESGVGTAPTPTEFLQRFGIAPDMQAENQLTFIGAVLFWLDKSPFFGLTDEVASVLDHLYFRLLQDVRETTAAETAAAAFGEVNGHSSETLPLWSVWHALKHNIAEADDRQKRTAEKLDDTIAAIMEIIEERITQVRKQIAEIENQKKQSTTAAEHVQNNQASTYWSIHTEGVLVYDAHQTVITEQSSQSAELQEELEELMNLQLRLIMSLHVTTQLH